MRTVVVGPGAMGCLVAGLLKKAGRDVALLDRNGARAEVISRNGLVIEDGAGLIRVEVPVFTDASRLGAVDLVVICVKAFDTAAAVEHARGVIGRNTLVLSLQNGAGNSEQIRKSVDAGMILCGATGQGATGAGFGHVIHAGHGATCVASLDRKNLAAAGETARLLTESGIETTVFEDAEAVVWSKLVVNAAINPLTAILGVCNGALLEDPEVLATMRLAIAEAVTVAAARGIRLMYADAAGEVQRTCRTTAGNISSMLQDVRRRRRTEIESITGVIVREGALLGLKTQVNSSLLARVLALHPGP